MAVIILGIISFVVKAVLWVLRGITRLIIRAFRAT
jgi:hypothetical protein